MVPFKAPGADARKVRYNLIHSRTRQKIEHSLGLLTSRWRFLWKHLYLLDLLRVSKTIYACCVLHNICINEGDDDENFETRRFGFEEFMNENQMENDPDITITDDNEDEPFVAPTTRQEEWRREEKQKS